MNEKVGDRLKLTTDIYDEDTDNAYPPGYIAYKGDIVIVRKVFPNRLHVAHEGIVDRSFVLHPGEFKNEGQQ